ncbi:MAG: CRTAC1 family protein [Planctomycetota bacterium]
MSYTRTSVGAVLAIAMATAPGTPASAQIRYADVTRLLGLSGQQGTAVQFADLDVDGYADLIVDARLVFMNREAPDGSGRVFEPVAQSGIPDFKNGLFEGALSTAFADFDGDRVPDCLWVPYCAPLIDGFTLTDGSPKGVAWLKGRGDGTFADPVRIEAVAPKAHDVIAIADVDRDGLLDVYLGASFIQAGWWRSQWKDPNGTNEGYTGDLLLHRRDPDGQPGWERVPLPEDSGAHTVPGAEHTEPPAIIDAAGRPTYGALIASLDGTGHPSIVELNYGRRANRVWFSSEPTDEPFTDRAPAIGLDGDDVRHGVYPEWATRHPRLAGFTHRPELPYRVHGNTFDAEATDLDNDGDLDLFVAQIRHGWAGSSSDPTAVWRNLSTETGTLRFEMIDPATNGLSRAPADNAIRSWNEGDLYCATLDADHDGRVDLLLSSGDYQDDQRLRLFRQQWGGGFVDVTPWSGLRHDGSQLISLADLDHDGRLDIAAGQRFMRYSETDRDGRTPGIAIYTSSLGPSNTENDASNSITIAPRFASDTGANHFGLGAIVRCTAIIRGERITQTRQLNPIGGRKGKQHEFLVHFGLGDAEVADVIEIIAPNQDLDRFVFRSLPPGRHELVCDSP